MCSLSTTMAALRRHRSSELAVDGVLPNMFRSSKVLNPPFSLSPLSFLFECDCFGIHCSEVQGGMLQGTDKKCSRLS